MTLLKVEKIKKQYIHKDGIVDALNNINIEINNGDFITITGASGSGKTTLLLALAGLIRITHGQITFKDKRLDSASDKVLADFRNKHVGFVMQNFALIPYLTAIQNVMIPLSLSKISIKKQKTRDSLGSTGADARAFISLHKRNIREPMPRDPRKS